MAPIPAASVVLLRQAIGFEVFLLKRTKSASFFGGAHVFPGGKVEALDGELSAFEDAHQVAAARELYEEAGILLGRCSAPAPVVWKLRDEGFPFQRALESVRSGPPFSLVPFSRWITPSQQPARFDTRFYLASLPSGQRARCDEGETTDGLWVTPKCALRKHEAGEIFLPPPMVRILQELCTYPDSVRAALMVAGLRPSSTVLPKLKTGDQGVEIHLSGSEEYDELEGDGHPLSERSPELRFGPIMRFKPTPKKVEPLEPEAKAVIEFWFGDAPEIPDFIMQRWWKKDPAFDSEIATRFGSLHQRMVSTRLCDEWKVHPGGRLAAILVLDQFSRNLFRNSERAFENDEQALALALEGVRLGHDKDVPVSHRRFFYLPLMHAEDLEMQAACIRGMKYLSEEPGETKESLRFAQLHYDVIERFGRFPHRNAVLGRPSCDEEEYFLAEEEGFKG